MASIKRYPWISHFLGSPTGYVVHLQKGTIQAPGRRPGVLVPAGELRAQRGPRR